MTLWTYWPLAPCSTLIITQVASWCSESSRRRRVIDYSGCFCCRNHRNSSRRLSLPQLRLSWVVINRRADVFPRLLRWRRRRSACHPQPPSLFTASSSRGSTFLKKCGCQIFSRTQRCICREALFSPHSPHEMMTPQRIFFCLKSDRWADPIRNVTSLHSCPVPFPYYFFLPYVWKVVIQKPTPKSWGYAHSLAESFASVQQ